MTTDNETPPPELIPHKSRFRFKIIDATTGAGKTSGRPYFRLDLKIIYDYDGLPTEYVDREVHYYYTFVRLEQRLIAEHKGLPVDINDEKALKAVIGKIYKGQVYIQRLYPENPPMWVNSVSLTEEVK